MKSSFRPEERKPAISILSLKGGIVRTKSVMILMLLLASTGISCKKSSPAILSGLYTEVSPDAGGITLNFIGDKVVQSESGGSYRDTFYYALSPGKIALTPAWTNQYGATSLDFVILNANTIKIENLNASIPEEPKIYMIFRK